MQTSGNTILITGASSGIGRAMAELFIEEGNTVIICARREERLREMQEKHPDKVHFLTCDISQREERVQLFATIQAEFPELNMLINNAGIQRKISFLSGESHLETFEQEIATNLTAPIHLSELFIPMLRKQKEGAIVNVSSGLAFTPLAHVPVYCATKAAIHSFSLSLRHQLRETPVRVFEIIPPIVDTELGGSPEEDKGVHAAGLPPRAIAEALREAMREEVFEKAVGFADGLRQQREQAFERLNNR